MSLLQDQNERVDEIEKTVLTLHQPHNSPMLIKDGGEIECACGFVVSFSEEGLGFPDMDKLYSELDLAFIKHQFEELSKMRETIMLRDQAREGQ